MEQLYKGILHGENVEFDRVFRGRRLTDKECAALCAGKMIPLYDLIRGSTTYAITAKLVVAERMLFERTGAYRRAMIQREDVLINDHSETIESLNAAVKRSDYELSADMSYDAAVDADDFARFLEQDDEQFIKAIETGEKLRVQSAAMMPHGTLTVFTPDVNLIIGVSNEETAKETYSYNGWKYDTAQEEGFDATFDDGEDYSPGDDDVMWVDNDDTDNDVA